MGPRDLPLWHMPWCTPWSTPSIEDATVCNMVHAMPLPCHLMVHAIFHGTYNTMDNMAHTMVHARCAIFGASLSASHLSCTDPGACHGIWTGTEWFYHGRVWHCIALATNRPTLSSPCHYPPCITYAVVQRENAIRLLLQCASTVHTPRYIIRVMVTTWICHGTDHGASIVHTMDGHGMCRDGLPWCALRCVSWNIPWYMPWRSMMVCTMDAP